MASSNSIIPANHKKSKELAARSTARAVVKTGAQQIAKESGKQVVVQGAKQIAKTAANPLLLVGDIAGFGVEKASGSKNAGRAASLAVYTGTGAAVGGPIGAAGAVAIWGVGQAISSFFD